MPFADSLRCGRAACVAAVAAVLVACGGNSTETTITGGGLTGGGVGPEVVLTEPQGANTTEIVVDSGPESGFVLGVANLPYVTVTVCAPGSTTSCVTIDHVFLDTGSIGLRLLASAVSGVNLPPMTQAGGTVAECYPFVVGAVWGPMARADLHVGGESALNLPMQIIRDRNAGGAAPPADCQTAANGELLDSLEKLQAKGVLGVGMVNYDCGVVCEDGDYSGGYTLYYRCDTAGACAAAAVPADEQVQNPVSKFAVNNNGTIVILPALPETGASVARGRLVFGIGTQTNNQLRTETVILRVQTDPTQADYLYVGTQLGTTRYAFSYFDSGSNGLFFDEPALTTRCLGNGAGDSWYCPSDVQTLSALVTDAFGTTTTVPLSIASADRLFATANSAFGNLGGGSGGNEGAFVWGLPFFFGRHTYTAIWGQALATNGPWYGL
jgi:hypothetical protein